MIENKDPPTIPIRGNRLCIWCKNENTARCTEDIKNDNYANFEYKER